jgi:hypothetical protein
VLVGTIVANAHDKIWDFFVQSFIFNEDFLDNIALRSQSLIKKVHAKLMLLKPTLSNPVGRISNSPFVTEICTENLPRSLSSRCI